MDETSPGKAEPLLVTRGAVAGALLHDIQRMRAHASHPSALHQSPEQLVTFFGRSLEVIERAAEALALTLADSIKLRERGAGDTRSESVEGEQREEAARSESPEADAAAQSEAGQGAAQAAPLTFGALARAVEVLTRDVQTRIWPEQEAGELRSTVVEAVSIVQAATKELLRFLLAQCEATSKRGRIVLDERRRPAREPAGLHVACIAVQGALALTEAFADMREAEAGEPLARIMSSLGDVQRGIMAPLFHPARKHAATRQTDAAILIGLAASAMDARQKAGVKRRDASLRIAGLFAGVSRNAGKTEPGVTEKTVAYWRDLAKQGELTPPEAQGRWQTYRAISEEPPPNETEAARRERFEKIAREYERAINRILKSHGPDFVLTGRASQEAQPQGGAKATGIREARLEHSNPTRG